MTTGLLTIAADMVSPDARIRIRGAVEYLRLEAHCDSVLVAYKNSAEGDYTIVQNSGYPEQVAEHLTGEIEQLPEFRQQFRDYQAVKTWEDVPEFPASYSGARILRPVGFNNGFLMVLHDRQGRTVGMCQGNIAGDRFAGTAKELLETLRPTFTDFAARHHQRSAFGLTARENEILNLLRKGLSNSEISDTLFLSSRTVSTHVERILRKLGVNNRVAAAVRATEIAGPAPSPE
ncbi:response regulator transcription factor [Gordonia sp. 852002-51296_SCH5728562-b]|uniref:response regulator transcription factor n=1 Tax=Gordonia sp. 852002-51296_SCH5728562-b TaxID=1834101 RepID=UPI0007EB22BC|nr:response regulator transcription factor [Gordonia sp. 852002-51296_SCH5728562-b]OBA35715.1 helix-turn-helix transcriptional regulator [Gordonia sp. 852002-51296_SCH5728562-b]